MLFEVVLDDVLQIVQSFVNVVDEAVGVVVEDGEGEVGVGSSAKVHLSITGADEWGFRDFDQQVSRAEDFAICFGFGEISKSIEALVGRTNIGENSAIAEDCFFGSVDDNTVVVKGERASGLGRCPFDVAVSHFAETGGAHDRGMSADHVFTGAQTGESIHFVVLASELSRVGSDVGRDQLVGLFSLDDDAKRVYLEQLRRGGLNNWE